MPVKIRLARHGRSSRPFYHIVVADSRTPRDGKFIEKLGIYNPLTNPATIELDFDKALNWLLKGAQPTDTCRTILSDKGVMLKKHLLGGVTKKALTQEQADAKFEAWVSEKQTRVKTQIDNLIGKKDADKKSRFDAESKAREAKAVANAKKRADLLEKAAEQTAENTEAAAE